MGSQGRAAEASRPKRAAAGRKKKNVGKGIRQEGLPHQTTVSQDASPGAGGAVGQGGSSTGSW